MKAEALEFCRRGMTLNVDTYDSRQCVDQVLARVPEAERPKIIEDMLKPDSYWHFSYAMPQGRRPAQGTRLCRLRDGAARGSATAAQPAHRRLGARE